MVYAALIASSSAAASGLTTLTAAVKRRILVRGTLTAAYAFGKSGFVKESVSVTHRRWSLH
jgi:hypothetical protein